VYVAFVVYASLYPFSGWRMGAEGLGMAFDYLSAPPEKYVSRFDVFANLLGYAPIGALLVAALFPRVRGAWALCAATFAAFALSANLEALQTFLPSRVPSRLDLAVNTLGAFLGGLCVLALEPNLLQQRAVYHLRRNWFVPHNNAGLLLSVGFVLAQISPQAQLFACGRVLPLMLDAIQHYFEIDWHNLLWQAPNLRYFKLLELVVTSAMTLAAILFALNLMRRQAPRLALLVSWLAAIVFVKTVASSLNFAPEQAWVWLTGYGALGLIIGACLAWVFSYAPKRAQLSLMLLAWLLAMLLVNLSASNSYFTNTLQFWEQGRFARFAGLAALIAALWPIAAIAVGLRMWGSANKPARDL
jgi:VanZ family protein